MRRVRLNVSGDALKERAEQDAVAEPVVAVRIVDEHAAWHALPARGMAVYRGDDCDDGRCDHEEEDDGSPGLRVHDPDTSLLPASS